ncbi:uncharacterized protein BX663DRAFT_461158 [Cokeromyces recurvatus]|uniref:uncharacterized protein n=1 Tax=Cokeromyces recurvatus TaxID=90255 RepID=UPI0022207022|nr:uncharacterized protein BX663DRAFT_461158 [Cokeromyces recurvatus]KAI7898941.1 hypothetical protein BX663DRAFT_461158 [Cokeromyces recurvatus]
MTDNSTEINNNEEEADSHSLTSMTAFSIMFVSIGMSCFIWQTLTTGWMMYKARKPIIGLVFFQAFLGVIVTFVTLLTSLTTIDCTFRLLFSVIGVNIGNMSLQFVLLWKAYLGNNRSKLILCVGCVPILSIAAFICANMTIGRSVSSMKVGYCDTKYPVEIVIAKTVIDCTSNTFLSGCFILVIYRHYRILGSGIQKTLIREGLIYCFGVCLSNILTGILVAKQVFGGNSPIIYTIDWYLASYLIIKQLKYKKIASSDENDEEDDDDEDSITIDSLEKKKTLDEEILQTLPSKKQINTQHYSIDGTLVPSPTSAITPYHSHFDDTKLSDLTIDYKRQKSTILISPPIIQGQASLFLDDQDDVHMGLK